MNQKIKNESLESKIKKNLFNIGAGICIGLLTYGGVELFKVGGFKEKQRIYQEYKQNKNYLFSEGWIRGIKAGIRLNPKIEKCDVWYVQVGAYKNLDNANSVAKKFNKIKYSTKIISEGGLKKVLVKTYNKEIADWLISDLSSNYNGGKRVIKEKCEVYNRSDLEKIIEYFAKHEGVDKDLALAITQVESKFDPDAVAYKIREDEAYVTSIDEETGRKTVDKVIDFNHETAENGHKIVTALGLMQIHERHRHNGYDININQYFNPIINSYIGIKLIREAKKQLKNDITYLGKEISLLESLYSRDGNEKAKIEELKRLKIEKEKNITANIAFIYHAGLKLYRKWDGIPRQEQTRRFIEDVLRIYKD